MKSGKTLGPGFFSALRRPDRRLVDGAVGILHERVRGQAALVERPARLGLGMGIDDGDDVEALALQVAHHPRGIGEALAVPGERVVAVLVVDVEPEDVRGHALEAEGVGQVPHPRFRVIAVARLLVAEGPHRRQGDAAGELRVALDDVFGRGPVDEVVVEGAVHRAEGEEAGIRAPDVERSAERVVEEDAVGAALAQHDVEGHGDVEGVGVVAVGVGVASSTSRRRSRRGSGRACPARPSSRPGRRRVRRRAAASTRAWCGP